MSKFREFISAAVASIEVRELNALRVISSDGKQLTLFAIQETSVAQGWDHFRKEDFYVDVENCIFVDSCPKGVIISSEVEPICLQLPEPVIDMTNVETGLYGFASEVDDLLAGHMLNLRRNCRPIGTR